MKNVDDLSDTELQQELDNRKKLAKEKELKEKKKAAAQKKKEVSKIEKEFTEALEKFYEELRIPHKMIADANTMFLNISEKYGIPVEIDGDTYFPNTVVKWQDENSLTVKELEWIKDAFRSRFNGASYTEPGSYWQPSEYC